MASENEANANKFAKLQEMVEELKSEMKHNSSQISKLKERNKKLEEENEMLKADLKDLRFCFTQAYSAQPKSRSKHLPPFTFDVLCYLNRDQLERFSIVCRSLKNLIDRYFRSKPYRVFDELHIRGGSYLLRHNKVRWHPNRVDYSVQQFLGGQKYSIDIPYNSYAYYSFAKMRPYLGPTVRVKWAVILIAGDSTCNIYVPIGQIESITYLWRNGNICIRNARDGVRIVAEYLQPILNSPNILQCQTLKMDNVHLSFKNYKILYAVKGIVIDYKNSEIDPNYWSQFFEQPGAKPLVVLFQLHPDSVVNLLWHLYKDFSSAVSPKAYKIIFFQNGRLIIKSIVESFKKVYSYFQPTVPQIDEELIEFQDKNKTSREKWEFKKGIPVGCRSIDYELCHRYTLERSSI